MKFWITFCLLWFYFLSQAQLVDTKTITADDGLFSNNIHAALIDSKGTLFLGSRSGLAVKNGNKFEPVYQTTKNKFNNIYDILEDPFAGKWIAGYGQGLLYFKGNKSILFQEKNGLADNIVRTVFYDNEKIYVGTINGISIISTHDFSITNPKFNQNPDYLFTVTSFFSIENKIYATTLNDGIFEITTTEVKKISDLKKTYSSVVYKNNLYIGTDKKLLQLNKNDFSIINEFNVGNVWRFLPTKTTLYFVSSGLYDTKGGLYELKKDTLFNLSTVYNLPFTDLKSIAFDQKNQYLFIGTQDNGLMQINLKTPVSSFKQFKEIYSLDVLNKNQYVFHSNGFSILEDNKIIKEISTAEFKRYQKQHPSEYQKKAVIKNHFYPIDYETPAEKIFFYSSQIHNNTLWVASNIGLFNLDLNGKFLNYLPVHVYHFTFFKNKLITAVPYAGVRIFDNINTFTFDYFHDWNQPHIPSEIVSIAQTDNAVYFASALNGLFEFKNGKFESLLINKIFNEQKLKRICTTKNGELIVVTDFNDVYILDVSKPIIKIKKHIAHHLIKGSTTFFVKEINSILYIGTNLGINVFNKGKYFLIDKAQGFTNYNSSKVVADNTNMYIGTKTGYFILNNSYFTKERFSENKAIISKIFINNTIVTDFKNTKTLELSYKENNIRLFFSVPNAKYPDKLQYKFRLKATEPWQTLSTENQLIFNYLNNGVFSVQLQITDEDTGNISEQTLLNFTIKPPFYYSLYFLLGCFIVILFITYFIFKSRIQYLNQKQKRDLKLIELQNEQEKKELLFDKQLADIKLQALKSQMNSHFLFNVLSSIQYYIICKDVDNALYYLEQFSKLIRTTLLYSDKETISLYEEINYIKQYLEIENLRTEHEIIFTTHIEDAVDSTNILIIPLLLQPFIENSIVHAFPASIENPKIDLYVEKTDRSIKIILRDNGIGYQEKKSKTHQSMGISIIQKQLDLTQKKLKNPITITSSKQGTEITIVLDIH